MYQTVDSLHLGSRTSAYRWIWRNYASIVVRRGFWVGLAAKLRDDGIVGADGVPYTVDALRHTYARVAADKAMIAGRAKARRIVPQVEVTPIAAMVADEPSDDDAGFEFKLTTKAR
jgi:hypothetical protein